ncbi:MAG: hypothetical protein BGN96_02670 [Bacteroidales bacterium 45-6]|nr:MAG: hypothetical protein BGN96_02670 [Bacteroidales bacterium 45-6]
MKFKDKLLKLFVTGGSEPSVAASEADTINRQQLLDQICNHFQTRFKEETTSEGMLFPTSFCIYLHEKDYTKQEQTFSFTAREAVNRFHRHIRAQLTNYPNYVPHSTYWLFQFSKFSEGNILDNIPSIKVGEPITISSIFATDFANNGIGNEMNIRATMHNKRSDRMEELNINRDAFLGMEMDAKDRFRFDFNKHFDKIMESSKENSSHPSGITLATLKCDTNFIGTDGREGNLFHITTEFVEISGKNDLRKMPNILRVNSDELKDSHLQIKYMPAEKRFKLAAFEEWVLLNERNVPKSSGGNILWVDLPNNSSIFLNGRIQINFTIKP